MRVSVLSFMHLPQIRGLVPGAYGLWLRRQRVPGQFHLRGRADRPSGGLELGVQGQPGPLPVRWGFPDNLAGLGLSP